TKPIVAVTGTNGKTTTTTLIGEMLKAGGKKVAVAGNIGNPLVEVDDTNLDYVVAEISSYQLEASKDFKPWVSVILNIQPDHLARHGSMEEYIKTKAKIFGNQTGDDYLVYNQDDSQVVSMVKPAKAKMIGFTKEQAGIITLNPEEIKIPGRHNLENSLAAAQAAYLCGIDKAIVAEVLKTFPGVEHRIEYVATKNGVEFRNDSKATNPDSTMVALDTYKGRGTILILGGSDKGTDLADLSNKVKQTVKEVVLIGEAADRFEQALRLVNFNSIHRATSLPEAVKKSYSLAGKDELVLLSPACASFDMFNNYEERGRVFKEVVQGL
ncbi:MAG: UDP-N-acetylmuramoyl-L-alanine--D-glutamate ligase, partial [bacterium]